MTLFDLAEYETAPELDDWCADDWETPDEVARFMGSLVTTADRAIIEPAAGTGQIARHLSAAAVCVELNPMRHLIGKAAAKDGQVWVCDDFLKMCQRETALADLIIGNPPFSLGMEFLAASFEILADSGRVLFLLPSQYFQAQERAGLLKESGLCITRQWQIAGRVGFLKQGKPYNQRQCYDSVFELKKAEFFTSGIQIVDPYGKL